MDYVVEKVIITVVTKTVTIRELKTHSGVLCGTQRKAAFDGASPLFHSPIFYHSRIHKRQFFQHIYGFISIRNLSFEYLCSFQFFKNYKYINQKLKFLPLPPNRITTENLVQILPDFLLHTYTLTHSLTHSHTQSLFLLNRMMPPISMSVLSSSYFLTATQYSPYMIYLMCSY